ncbi:hypothetical protein C818_00204 [Lachnospiraceae bacterium MD308]|nr:hypothetical protein C818_00204 [Lachnospiraceae bacterium MD308]
MKKICFATIYGTDTSDVRQPVPEENYGVGHLWEVVLYGGTGPEPCGRLQG